MRRIIRILLATAAVFVLAVTVSAEEVVLNVTENYAVAEAFSSEVIQDQVSVEEDLSSPATLGWGNSHITVGGSTLPQLPTPTDLEWGYDHNAVIWNNATQTASKGVAAIPGYISFKPNYSGDIKYKYTVYNVNNPNKYVIEVVTNHPDFNGEWVSSCWFSGHNPESGTYYFTVVSLGDGINYRDSEVATSGTWTYTKPSAKLGLCSNAVWAPNMYQTFTGPADMSMVGGFEIQVFYADTLGGEKSWIGTQLTYDMAKYHNHPYYTSFPTESADYGYYYFKVRALSADLNMVCNGDWTEFSPVYCGHSIHEWKAADCTTPKTCINCKTTEGSITDHQWKDATCTEPKTCTGCGITEGKALGHNYNKNICTRCGHDKNVPETVPVYRFYNPYTNEHLLVSDEAEKNGLVKAGWTLEGIAWNAPKEGSPVYRLYNPDDWHTYTSSEEEMRTMVAAGWSLDGPVSCTGTQENGKPVYRLFNPYEKTNFHLFTAGVEERDMLVNAGWILEGIAWYAVK